MSTEALIDDSKTLAAEIGKLLAGKPPVIVTTALAVCLARCVAGHVQVGDPVKTARYREQIIEANFNLVRQLVKPNAIDIGTWLE